MNIFDYEGKEFDKKLDEIFKNTDKDKLKEELKECGLVKISKFDKKVRNYESN